MSDKLQEAARHEAPSSKEVKRQRTESTRSGSVGEKSAEDSSQTGLTTAQQAMTNPVVLDCIFANLRTKSLVQVCRLVNKEWNKAAMKILKRRTDAYVKVNGQTNIEALEVCIESSRSQEEIDGKTCWVVHFPFCEIDLQLSVEDFKYSHKEWLTVGLIRRFSRVFTRLRLTTQIVSDNVIIGLLSGRFSHIESLELNRITRYQSSNFRKKKTFSEGCGFPVKFEKLKYLAMGNDGGCDRTDKTFLTELLQCCPNLQCIEGFTNAHLSAIASAGKLGLVKSVRMCWCVENNQSYPTPSEVETLIIANGNHEEYRDGPGGNELRLSTLRPLLESSRESLRCLQVRCNVDDDARNGDVWPKLSKLNSLEIHGLIDFPDSVEDIFPTLKSLHIGADWDAIPKILGPSNSLWKEPLLSVNKLEVYRNRSYEDLARISKAVPNVRQLVLHFSSWDMPQSCSSNTNEGDEYEYVEDIPWWALGVYTEEVPLINPWQVANLFQHMEPLHVFAIKLPEPKLDEFFTGIPAPRVEILKANPQLDLRTSAYLQRILKKRSGSSVVSLSGLKELIIGFTISEGVTEEDWKSDSISHVAIKYGFDMAPEDMKIRFLYDHYNKNAHLIEELLLPAYDSHRVTLGHWSEC